METLRMKNEVDPVHANKSLWHEFYELLDGWKVHLDLELGLDQTQAYL